MLALFWSYSRGHRRWLVHGSLGGIVVVLARLALPFPLRSLSQAAKKHAPMALPFGLDGLDPFVAIAVALLLLFTALGAADLFQRVCFARFSIGTLRRARAVAIEATRADPQSHQSLRSGELVSRLIGDTARAKSGLKAFLIHVVTNILLVIGVTVVLLAANALLAQVFVGAFLVVAAMTWFCARATYHMAHRFRHKESELANQVEKTWTGVYGDKTVARLNAKSADSEARMTRLEGLCAWGTHIALGLAIVAAVLLGRHEITSGELKEADLLLFLLYAVLLRAPLVKIVSQGASTGKIVACAERIAELCEPSMNPRPLLPPLRQRIELTGLKVATKKVDGLRRRRLGPIDLAIHAGEHVAIVGPASSGKSTLLRALAGEQRARRGAIRWDGLDLATARAADRSGALFFASDAPSWRRTPLRELLTVELEGPLGKSKGLRKLLGGFKAIRTLRRRCGSWSSTLASADLSLAESRAINLIRALRAPTSVLLLDEPFAGMTRKERAMAARQIRARSGTVVAAFREEPEVLGTFDRVITMLGGRVTGDAPPPPAAASTSPSDSASVESPPDASSTPDSASPPAPSTAAKPLE